jgi:hypothetical protein
VQDGACCSLHPDWIGFFIAHHLADLPSISASDRSFGSRREGLSAPSLLASPEQAKQWDALSEFEVEGSQTDTRYRIRRGKVMNVHELDRSGNIVAHWCFAPKGDPVMGDILLAQKIALETMERDALKAVNKNPIHPAGSG